MILQLDLVTLINEQSDERIQQVQRIVKSKFGSAGLERRDIYYRIDGKLHVADLRGERCAIGQHTYRPETLVDPE